MTESNEAPAPPEQPGRRARAALLLAGILLPQFLLYGPSLVGRKILLPLDVLAQPNYYLPPQAVPGGLRTARDPVKSDIVVQDEMHRRFAVEQVRLGRVPLWNPHVFCGAPFLAANQPAVFSPYRAIDYLWPGPWVLAWDQVLRALVAGVGAYLFFRRETRTRFLPAAVGAWCFPLTGMLVMWVNSGIGATVTWLPWALLAAGRAVRSPGAPSAAAVALTTAATQVSGHAATGAQVLLAAGAYSIWRLVREHRGRGAASPAFWRSAGAVAAGWVLGVMLAAPQVLPTAEYLRASVRIASRVAGETEAPAAGFPAIAQLVLPDAYGSTERDSVYLAPGNRQESAAGGYAGLLVALVAAPMALVNLADARRRGGVLFWLVLALASMVPTLDVPLLARLFHVPPLNALRNNRLVFVTGFAILALGVTGLDTLLAGDARVRRLARPMLCLAAFGAVCLAYFTFDVPADIAARVPEGEDLRRVRAWFRAAYGVGAGLCAVAVTLWTAVDRGAAGRQATRLAWCVAALAVAEMVASAWRHNAQSDPSLYYPPVPALEEVVRRAPAARAWPVFCLPPNLAMAPGLLDVRGYDAVDPARAVELVTLASDPSFPASPPYARTQWAVPRMDLPLLNATGVRHLVGRGNPPPLPNVVYNASDYWVVENPAALPRAYVPRRAEVVNDAPERLRRLGSPQFAPADVVYVESDGAVPSGPYDADARIVAEGPTWVRIDVDARTPALVVLADHWDGGWAARLDGSPVPILRANHAFRAVQVPAGKATLAFSYEPASFRVGLRWAAVSVAVMALWLAATGLTRRLKAAPPAGIAPATP